MKTNAAAESSDREGRRGFLFDLGFHHGEGLNWLVEEYGIDSGWTVFAFEPNSRCRPHLLRAALAHRARVIPMPFAVADAAGAAVFQREAVCTGGVEIGEGSHLRGIGFGLDARGAGTEEVWRVDFAEFLAAMVPADRTGAFVVVKMDIEGAEYGILRRMLATGAIDRVDVLHVEFHQRLMESETDESTEVLRTELRRHVRLIDHW